MAHPRYIIGVDLGTTNTAVAFVDTRSAEQRVEVFPVAQLVAPGELDRRRQLPSFVYLAGEHDLAPAETALPWDGQRRRVVGELARDQGARMPNRMVSSSKSWLCHGAVDRHAPVLPWGVEGGPKLSPVEASSLVLQHVAEAWDYAHRSEPDARFVDQEVIVTVPASFDEAARELTQEAAERAGLAGIALLEEPQAAFYAWVNTHRAKKALGPGDRILVFDIGGGTTDFTLIAVGADGETFERTAVSDHLLLGGDNIDLTLAKQIEARLVEGGGGRKLDTLQWHGLVHACRMAKEAILSADQLDEVPITVAGRGSRLIGATLKDRVTRGELEQTIHGGFFPLIERGEGPRRTRGGLQEFGLPFAADPAVTRHLAAFLTRHQVERVDAVLFNGGAMAPASLRRRVLEQLERWQPEAGPPRELANELPELAVAHGAAYYGLVRRGFGARISGGTARAFYVGVGASGGEEMAICIAPKGLDEGTSVELPRDFRLVTNRPVSFKLYSSTTRADEPGALVPVGDGLADTIDDDSDLLELPPIVTVLRARGRGEVVVHLEVRITELGALEIWCREPSGAPGSRGEAWKLSFDMRAGGARVEARTQDEVEVDPRVPEAKALVEKRFTGSPAELPRLIKELEELLEAPRDDWSMATARALFDAALQQEEARKGSPRHEARWLNLTGFCLRPGFGAPLDEWRAKQMWRIFNEELQHPREEQCRLAWWIVWRRIAGGLTKGQQEQFYDRLAQLFLPGTKGKKKWHQIKPSPQEAAEMLRCLANMERFSAEQKMALGDELLRRLETRKGREEPLHFWALGRLGARVPLYGPLNCVVPASKAGAWLATLLELDWPDPQKAAFPMAQLGRRTGDRSRDLDEELRTRLSARLRTIDGAERMALLVEQVVSLEAREERVALGDSLPAGLRLVTDDESA